MKAVRVQIEKLSGNEDLSLPRYMTSKSAGLDIFAAVKKPLTIQPGERVMIPTGLKISLPEGFEAEIRPRSGLAYKNGITLINTPGTIDSDYRGEVILLMVNFGKEPFVINRGDRVAQMIINEVCRVEWEISRELDDTDRGSGGFGHTGY